MCVENSRGVYHMTTGADAGRWARLGLSLDPPAAGPIYPISPRAVDVIFSRDGNRKINLSLPSLFDIYK